jgi:hypothetical protein
MRLCIVVNSCNPSYAEDVVRSCSSKPILIKNARLYIENNLKQKELGT